MTELREKLNNIVEEKNTKIVPENIKAGLKVFDVEGTFTSDATAKAEDIVLGKTAYVNGEKVEGALVAEEIDNFTKYQVAYNSSTGYGLFENNKYVTSANYFDCTRSTSVQDLFSGCSNLTFAKIKNTQNITSFSSVCKDCTSLKEFILADAPSSSVGFGSSFNGCTNLETVVFPEGVKAKTLASTFNGCKKLVDIPWFDTSETTNFNNTFANCNSLSDESLNKILLMCANATSYTGTKTFKAIGVPEYIVGVCKNLSNYQAFLDAGWTMGY